MNAHGERFIDGAVGRGVERELAERVFEQIRGFSGFGFPKSHAAAFGLLAYQSTWLRVHYGPEFLCALLNEQPMGFYPPDALVHEAQRRGIEVRAADVNREWGRVHGRAPRAGSGARGADRARLRRRGSPRRRSRRSSPSASAAAPYRGLADLASRSGVGADGLERLAWAGACESLGRSPRARARDAIALWQLGVARGGERRHGRGRRAARAAARPARAARAPPARRLGADRRRLRLDRDHPRRAPDGADAPGARPSSSRAPTELDSAPDRAAITVAGLVVARQRPATAKGSSSCCWRTRPGWST